MSEHTDLAATTTRQKIITDAEQMVAVTAWGAVDGLDAETKERLYGVLAER